MRESQLLMGDFRLIYFPLTHTGEMFFGALDRDVHPIFPRIKCLCVYMEGETSIFEYSQPRGKPGVGCFQCDAIIRRERGGLVNIHGIQC